MEQRGWTEQVNLVQTEPESKMPDQDTAKCNEEDETTQCIKEEMKKAEQILDKEVQEVQSLHLRTPKVRWKDSHEERGFETCTAAQAIQIQLDERGTKMEVKWKERRADAEKKWNPEQRASVK